MEDFQQMNNWKWDPRTLLTSRSSDHFYINIHKDVWPESDAGHRPSFTMFMTSTVSMVYMSVMSWYLWCHVVCDVMMSVILWHCDVMTSQTSWCLWCHDVYDLVTLWCHDVYDICDVMMFMIMGAFTWEF